MNQVSATAGAEWRRHWSLVLGGAMGYSVINLPSFGIAAFVRPLEQAFGWSRAEVMSGLSISSAFGIVAMLVSGLFVDRIGPRRVGLFGIALVCSGIALLGMLTADFLWWTLAWIYISCGIALVQGMVWTRVVAERFEKGRGLAIAAVLNGSALTMVAIPLVSTSLITAVGWRQAFVGVGAIWFIVAFPLAFWLFRDERSRPVRKRLVRQETELPGVTLAEAMRMGAFWRIVFTMFAFILYTTSLSPNLIVLLSEKGATLSQAAQIAALLGICGIIARLSVGHLLDRLPTLLVATSVFVIPVIGGAILLLDNPSIAMLAIAVACFGATIGAENDVLYFLVARYCGMRRFGSLLGVIGSAGALAGTFAPVAAGLIHDRTGSYDLMIGGLIGLMALCAVLMATMGRPPVHASRAV